MKKLITNKIYWTLTLVVVTGMYLLVAVYNASKFTASTLLMQGMPDMPVPYDVTKVFVYMAVISPLVSGLAFDFARKKNLALKIGGKPLTAAYVIIAGLAFGFAAAVLSLKSESALTIIAAIILATVGASTILAAASALTGFLCRDNLLQAFVVQGTLSSAIVIMIDSLFRLNKGGASRYLLLLLMVFIALSIILVIKDRRHCSLAATASFKQETNEKEGGKKTLRIRAIVSFIAVTVIGYILMRSYDAARILKLATSDSTFTDRPLCDWPALTDLFLCIAIIIAGVLILFIIEKEKNWKFSKTFFLMGVAGFAAAIFFILMGVTAGHGGKFLPIV